VEVLGVRLAAACLGRPAIRRRLRGQELVIERLDHAFKALSAAGGIP
jgi:hypothetical protein